MAEGSAAKTAAGVAIGIIVGVVGLFFVMIFICAGLVSLGQSVERQEALVTTPAGDTIARVEISDINASIVDTNNVFTKYSYTFNVTNNGSTVLTKSFTVELLDANGMIIDEDHLYGQGLSPGSNTLRGSILAGGDMRNSVASVSVKER